MNICRDILLVGIGLFSPVTTLLLAAEAGGGPKWHPGHYIFVGINPGPIQEKSLQYPRFRGVQKAYNWNKLEVARDRYDWSELDADLKLLAARGKYLALQIQFKTFQKGTTAVPRYIVDGAEEFGPARTYPSHSQSIYPSIWNPAVATRFHAFLRALGQRYDRHPNFEFVNLPETAPSPFGSGTPQAPKTLEAAGYTHESYLQAVKENMRVLAEAFPHTTKVQYINFGPAGALQKWAEYGATLGVGLGGPDVHPTRDIPSYPIWKAMAGRVPLGAAVQFEDYYNTPRQHESGLIDVRRNYVFARELKLNYVFWCVEPRAGFEKVVALLNSPDVPSDPAGGLNAAVPEKR